MRGQEAMAWLAGLVSRRRSLADHSVDIAHRAALLYSFALLLVAMFVELGGWGTVVNLIAAGRWPSTSSPPWSAPARTPS
jgi:hypothetical protein